LADNNNCFGDKKKSRKKKIKNDEPAKLRKVTIKKRKRGRILKFYGRSIKTGKWPKKGKSKKKKTHCEANLFQGGGAHRQEQLEEPKGGENIEWKKKRTKEDVAMCLTVWFFIRTNEKKIPEEN